jgi:hypothetical protein
MGCLAASLKARALKPSQAGVLARRSTVFRMWLTYRSEVFALSKAPPVNRNIACSLSRPGCDCETKDMSAVVAGTYGCYPFAPVTMLLGNLKGVCATSAQGYSKSLRICRLPCGPTFARVNLITCRVQGWPGRHTDSISVYQTWTLEARETRVERCASP